MEQWEKQIIDRLFEMQDAKYRDFNSGLNPAVDKDNVIGVRTPDLRSYAKEIGGTELAERFMKKLPHRYFEENQLHAFLIEGIKDYDSCIKETEKFLPFVDNWATCDQMTPKIMKKYPDKLIVKVKEWIGSEHTYTIRYGIKRLMDVYLGEEFRPEYLEWAAAVRSDEYYVNMMIAWFFATALAKQYSSAVVYIEEGRLSPWVHRKTIQKACESYRVSDENKAYLKKFR